MGIEEWKKKIHAFKIPIRNKKTLFLVQCGYFFTPIILGYYIMNAVTPSEEVMRERLQVIRKDQQIDKATQFTNEALQTVLTTAEKRSQNPPQ
eukprot:c19441_g3_i1.p1 GENE.c19441_g3_i1~~c19441_g3_i1.p1  ORF type:complete len:104 (-),score=32.47 c19441_g3_i1:62-340(-)